MTREEAINIFDDNFTVINTHGHYTDEEVEQARQMAIKALEQEPCEDAISRQAVLDINESHHGQMPNHINHQIWEEIKVLPPVNPQESKTGHWIINKNLNNRIQCSECGCFSGLDESDIAEGYELNKYCSNCGAKMIESEEVCQQKKC